MKLACVSSVYGKKFHDISGAWYEWNRNYIPLPVDFHLVSLDGGTNKQLSSQVEYSFENGANMKRPLAWGDGDYPRLKKLIELCAQGTTCIHMDLDVVLLKDITPIIKLPYSFIISGAFGFPKDTVEKIGFVGCTGFYIAKPESLPFLEYWGREVKDTCHLDQLAINKIFEKLVWNTEIVVINKTKYCCSVSLWNDIPIMVLDSELLPRNIDDKNEKSFGIHHPLVISEYWKIDEEISGNS